MSVIEIIYKDPIYLKACQKIAGQEADDLFQFINIKIYELEKAGKFNCKKLYPYYFTMAKREFYSQRDKFAKEHRQRINFEALDDMKQSRNRSNETTYRYKTNEPTNEDELINVNAERFQDLDDFARTPSKNESEQMIKDVFKEITKQEFKGITDLSNRTGIHKRTLYGALYRFRELYNDSINTL